MNRRRAITGAATLALLLAACGSDDNNATDITLATVKQAPDTTSATSATEGATAPSMTQSSTESSADDASTDDTASVNERIDDASQALQDGNFSAMLQALQLSGAAKDINNRAVTILAPTNQAFEDVPSDVARDLLTNPTKVDDIIKRHILDGTYTLDELKNQTTVKTIGGDTLTVATNGDQLTIDGAAVTQPKDTKFTGENGQELALFQIDKVLLPSG